MTKRDSYSAYLRYRAHVVRCKRCQAFKPCATKERLFDAWLAAPEAT